MMGTQNAGCPVCKLESAAVKPRAGRDAYQISCARCGDLEISGSANAIIWQDGCNDDRWKVSAWLRQMRPEVLTAELLEQARASKPPSLMQRAKRLLAALAQDIPAGRQSILDEAQISAYMARGWCHDEAELNFLLHNVLRDELGWLQSSDATGGTGSLAFAVTAKGLLELESAGNIDSVIGFCAMWFDDHLLPLYADVIAPAMRACGYDALRLDHKEYNRSIDDEIVASIRGARFVVAEMTGHRGGVYYEAGLAHGLGIPVIFMLREDDQVDVHFDVRQQNFILWKPDDLPEARQRLVNRIRATLGQGPLDPQR